MRIQRYASGLAQVGADEHPPLGGVRRGNGDGLVSGVCPVKVVLEPVQGQTHWGVEVGIHQRHLLRGVAGLVDEGTAGGEENMAINLLDSKTGGKSMYTLCKNTSV